MAPRKKMPSGPTPIDAIQHEDKRLNIPTADSEELLDEEVARSARLRYPRDPSLDPQLVWKGKDEQDGEDLLVDAPPIYIQEKIAPQVLIENLRRAHRGSQLDLFADFDGLSGWEAVEYYQHDANWSNRMILGDSLQVMASLAEKESLRGKVQMIYVDPPYGIDFGSNWQVSTGKRDVKDGRREDTTREVEQIKAFRDIWELGVHSYLAYLRDRLIVARDLLTDSGSVFVQIGSQNAHLIATLLSEIFGAENHVETIAFRKKTMPLGGRLLEGAYDYLVWYARNKDTIKYRPLFQRKNVQGDTHWNLAVLPTGEIQPLDRSQIDNHSLLPEGADLAQLISLYPVGPFDTGIYDYEYLGRNYVLPPGKSWPSPRSGMDRIAAAARLQPYSKGETLRYLLRLSDYPITVFNNVWSDTSAATGMTYVVETSPKVVQRCLLMTTDPGDLVVDPTCGSGTAAFVAEQWGRRWITIDTSRVALALARQRIMGAKYPYYLLTDSRDGHAKEAEVAGRITPDVAASGDVRKGFVYERVPHLTLKSIANNLDIKPELGREDIDAAIARHAETEILYDRPYQDNRKIRVAGRFTVESLSPHKTISPARPASERAADQDDVSAFERTILDNLLKAGVQNGRKKERLEFETLSPYPGSYIQADGIRKKSDEGTPQRMAVSIGPQFGTVDPEWIRKAAREATHGQGLTPRTLGVSGFLGC